MSLGEIQLDSLRRDRETEWFGLGYDLFSFDDGESYRVIAEAVGRDGEASAGAGLEILAFVGVWCGDCQDHLPGFARILDAVRFPSSRLRVYSLDRAKTFPGGEGILSRWKIQRLPTFVFLRGGREIGRIIEIPEESMLRDMARILSRA